jgi:hypothetical protein
LDKAKQQVAPRGKIEGGACAVGLAHPDKQIIRP